MLWVGVLLQRKLLAEWGVFWHAADIISCLSRREPVLTYDGLNVFHCLLIFFCRVDFVLIWGGSYHLRW
jgi:hypothetical protein